MFSHTTSATLVGAEPRVVDVQVHVGRTSASSSFALVGLPDTAIREAKQRVRSACLATGYRFPESHRVTVSLAPASLPKTGSSFDLPIALGVLSAAGLLSFSAAEVVAVGELGLDGGVRECRGTLAAAHVAAALRRPCLVPAASAGRLARLTGGRVIGVSSLEQAVAALDGRVEDADPATPPAEPNVSMIHPDLSDVRGQPRGRRAVEIAAAGGHHLLFVGPPGCGKTMLARRLPGVLPTLTANEWWEVACVYEAGGRALADDRHPPFRAPHHGASSAAILGGGSGIPVPGELSLATRGVLFLDELGEFPANVLDALRQPLEDGTVTIARQGHTVSYPAHALVVAATNPCPCGFAGDRVTPCRCSDAATQRYRHRLSGPLLDRFDLSVSLERPTEIDGPPGEPSETVRSRVEHARTRQSERGALNRDLTPSDIDELAVDHEAAGMLSQAFDRGLLTARGRDRVRRVARTIADLDDRDTVEVADIAEAMTFRRSS